MYKTKIFQTWSARKLQENVNQWLLNCSNRGIEIIDIRYNVENDKENDFLYSALILYKGGQENE